MQARVRHLSPRTEKAYVAWIRRYILFHGKRHPVEMGADEVTTFLSWLAVERKVAASTQNQALAALLFLYREILSVDLPWLDDWCARPAPGTCRWCSLGTRSLDCSAACRVRRV